MSHVPGPWKLIGTTICYDSDYGGPFRPIAECPNKANALLIAAAPELLVALRCFVENEGLINDDHFSGVQERLIGLSRELIARAEGK